MTNASSRARTALLALSVLAAAIVASSAPALARPAATAAASRATVVLRDIAFHSPRVTIRRGGSVTWQWRDGSSADAVSHTVTSTSRPHFHSAGPRNHGSYTVRFATAGTYRYECTIHVGMSGRVTVR